jgi:hypothetical protein
VRLDTSCVSRFSRQVAQRGVPLSKSSVGEYLACPARWAFRTVERQAAGPVSDELRLGRACHQVIAAVLLAGPDIASDESVARALDAQGVSPHLLPSAVDWVLWAQQMVAQRGGRIVSVEKSVRTGTVPGVSLSGRFDLVLADGSAGPLELLDWSFGRHPKFVQPEQMVDDLGTTIYRTLLAVAMPDRPEQVLISDVHVPGRQVLTVELDRDEVRRAWSNLQAIRDGMRSVAITGIVGARPGPQCAWCPFERRCPQAQVHSEEVR